jgi:carbamoyltransferase
MLILGIFTGKDSGVALIKKGEILYAANEERFNRQKMYTGFPKMAIEDMWRFTGYSSGDINIVAFGGLSRPAYENTLGFNEGKIDMMRRLSGTISCYAGKLLETHFAYLLLRFAQRVITSKKEIVNEIRKHGLKCPVHFVDHHLAHACSAYFTSGFDDCIIITSDGGGDGTSGGVYLGSKGKLERVSYSPRIHSAGNFWMYITVLLDMDPWKHGGKVTGLAAYEPSEKAYNILRKFYSYSEEKLTFINKKRLYLIPAIKYLKKILVSFNKAQIAYAAQKVLEENILGVVKAALKKYRRSRIALAGGTFSNVRLNQFISELPEVEDSFVHPNMGDGGIALGSAYAVWSKICPDVASAWSSNSLMLHAYLGPAYKEDCITNLLEKEKIKFDFYETGIEKVIALELIRNKVVAHFYGRMEYGPRALGNRSIFYSARDPGVNHWLNRQLKRTEFMPFAPIVTDEDAEKYFKGLKYLRRNSHFMTVTSDCTDIMRQCCPAAVHVDGTARPQLLLREQNLLVYNILREYEKLSGDPLLINTSFNMHEEPIVNTPEDALRAFRLAKLDVLVMERFMVKREDNENSAD